MLTFRPSTHMLIASLAVRAPPYVLYSVLI